MAITQAAFERELQVRLVSAGFELTKGDVQEILTTIGGLVEEGLRREGKDKTIKNPTVVVRGLGRFVIRAYPARKGRNPRTGEAIKIKASRKMRVQAPKAMRDALKVK